MRGGRKRHRNISRSSSIVDRQDLLREKTGKWACIPLSFVIGYLQSSKNNIHEDLFLSLFYGNLLILSVFGLRNKPQSLQLPGMFYTGGDEVDTGGLDTGVPQHIRQLCYIPAGAVERTGK